MKCYFEVEKEILYGFRLSVLNGCTLREIYVSCSGWYEGPAFPRENFNDYEYGTENETENIYIPF